MATSVQKYALITGASSGIGRAYAEQLAARGYNIVLVSNRADENEATAAAIAASCKVATVALYADLAAEDAAERLFEETRRRELCIDLLVCNAGLLLFGAYEKATSEELHRIIALHCITPALLCRYYGEEMMWRGGGRILLTASATAWMPYPTIAAYGATKGFLKNLAEALHEEWRGRVTVTAVYPGAVDTPLYCLSDKWRRRLIRMGIMLTPQRVARCGLHALFHGRGGCIPGLFTKICVWICRLLPCAVVRPLLRIPAVKRLL